MRAVTAALALAIVVGACGQRQPPLVTDDPVAVVEAYVAARNGDDWGAQRAFLARDAVLHPFGSRDEFRAAVVLDRDIRLLECGVTLESERTGSFVACSVEVTDLISAVSGRPSTNANAVTFAVDDGFVTDLPDFLPSDFVAESAIEAWAEAAHPREYRRACPDGVAGQSPTTGRRCAEFIADHVDEWTKSVVDAVS